MTTRAVVITASTRAAAGVYPDESGAILVAGLRGLGFAVDDAIVVADGQPVADALDAAIRDDVAIVLTTGGTGLTPADQTPELTAQRIDRPLPGIAEALRADARDKGIAMGMLSRGVAGVAKNTIIVNVAGSTGAARDAIAVLAPVLQHAVDQIRDGEHSAHVLD